MTIHKPKGYKKAELRGLGDAVAIVAEPIKQMIIRHGPAPIARLVENCNCDKRIKSLNELVPFSSINT